MTGPRVLTIAGSDPTGGAGIQADLKTIAALGGYGLSAVTAVTVQDTTGVRAVSAVAADLVLAQVEAVAADIGVDAVKIGLLPSAACCAAVAEALGGPLAAAPVVLDPVWRSSGGEALAGEGAPEEMVRRLWPLADLVTPNWQEAAKVLGRDLRTEADAEAALAELAALGSAGVLLTGGHGGGDTVSDRLLVAGERRTFSGPRLAASPHGTGCALSTAVAVGLGAGLGLAEAVERAVGYVRTAVAAAVEMGRGAPLLDHRCAGSSRRGI